MTQEALGSDVNRLTSLLVEICEANRDQRDYTRAEMRRAIREVAACFAIYRSYVEPARDEITDEDREAIGRGDRVREAATAGHRRGAVRLSARRADAGGEGQAGERSFCCGSSSSRRR